MIYCRISLRESAPRTRTFAEQKASAPLKAADLLGESRMRENRPYGLEGGEPVYPYQ